MHCILPAGWVVSLVQILCSECARTRFDVFRRLYMHLASCFVEKTANLLSGAVLAVSGTISRAKIDVGNTLIRATSATVLSVLFLGNEISKSRRHDPALENRKDAAPDFLEVPK